MSILRIPRKIKIINEINRSKELTILGLTYSLKFEFQSIENNKFLITISSNNFLLLKIEICLSLLNIRSEIILNTKKVRILNTKIKRAMQIIFKKIINKNKHNIYYVYNKFIGNCKQFNMPIDLNHFIDFIRKNRYEISTYDFLLMCHKEGTKI